MERLEGAPTDWKGQRLGRFYRVLRSAGYVFLSLVGSQDVLGGWVEIFSRVLSGELGLAACLLLCGESQLRLGTAFGTSHVFLPFLACYLMLTTP